MTQEYIDEVKEYCRVEEDDNDIVPLINAAIQKAEIETGKIFDEKKPLYAQIIKMIVLDWHDNKGSITNVNIHELPLTIGAQVILNQIAISSEFKRKSMEGE